MGVEMPIVEQIYQVLYQGKDAHLAAQDLLARDKSQKDKKSSSEIRVIEMRKE